MSNLSLRGKKILVVGGTGSVGQRLVDMIAKEQPHVVRIFSRDEHKQFEMRTRLGQDNNLYRYLIGDIRDSERVNRAARDVDIIFHVAAMKHVPACEYNPYEAVKTNVIGSQNIIDAAVQNGVERVLFTSSDKAINPTNAMGATKLLAERLIARARYSQGQKTRFSVVRFGNVMGTRGSVIPTFEQQILTHRKMYLTDPEMTRFMMTMGQAVKLMLDASDLATGGEIFVLKMPVIRLREFAEVCRELICEKYGIAESDIEMVETGIRAGEKMYEELMTDEEARFAYELTDMFVIDAGDAEFEKSDLGRKYLRRADVRPYSSCMESLLSPDEIRKMITEEQLI